MVPRQHLRDIVNMKFVSNDVVLVFYSDDRVIHFKSDGTVLHQTDDDVSNLMEGVDFKAESEIINGTKYIVFYKHPYFSILLYDESGNAKIVGRVNDDKIRENIKQAIQWLLDEIPQQSSESIANNTIS